MKQIFDWMREQTEDWCDEAVYFPADRKVIPVRRINRIIDNAEAKWESDCCEWKPTTYSMLDGKRYGYKTDCGNGHICGKYKTIISHYKYCHYCGKRIKILEVE